MQNKKSVLIGFGAGVGVTIFLVILLKMLCPFFCPNSEALGPKIDALYRAPSRGAENAPVVITEFIEFHSEVCKQSHPVLTQVLENYPEQVKLVFRHAPSSLTAGEGSFLTHEAAACAHAQGKFWGFHDAIFEMQGLPERAALDTLAQKSGLHLKTFRACLKRHFMEARVKDDAAEASRRRVQGTPTFFINGLKKITGFQTYEQWKDIIQEALNPQPALPPTQAPVTFNEEDLEGRPAKGPKNAPVTLVEFSDFHCPYCARVAPTLEQLMKNYEGQIRLVWHHYPLPMHAGAERTHEASECAHEQEKFWPYHDKLFQTLGVPKDDLTLVAYAKELKLNTNTFKQCLESSRHKSLIQGEIQKGAQVGVQGTPAVFVNGELISGAYPYEFFDRIVKTKLEKR
ncbi:MAG: thioredoxin domain-containing protein [Candidatus Omnitrophica bacterium]|nr:thioredoxin domain-containing protein [Candidatus Omnitrophota bacterium]